MDNLVKVVTIGDSAILVKEYQGKRVVTLSDIDTVHQKTDDTARRNFNRNKKHFIEGEDYFGTNSYEAKNEFGITAPNGLTLITESGYLMLVKSFNDDLAWEVQRNLVNNYFRSPDQLQNKFIETLDTIALAIIGINKRLQIMEGLTFADTIRKDPVKRLTSPTVQTSQITISGLTNILGVSIPVVEDSTGTRVMLLKTIADIHKRNSGRMADYIKKGIAAGRYIESVDYINVKGNKEIENALVDFGALSRPAIHRSTHIFLFYSSGYRKLMEKAYSGYRLNQYANVIRDYFTK
jgi:hypothetical protein